MVTYFTADLHLGCNNLRKHTRPEYGTIEEHDDTIIANINRQVARNDRLIILGDFCLKKPGKYRYRINCRQVFFILGNHDKEAQIRAVFGGNVWLGKLVKLPRGEGWCSHYPHCYWPESHHGSFHCHGHTHHNQAHEAAMDLLGPRRSMDVGVDSAKALFGSHRPITEDELFDRLAGRPGHGLVSR